MIWEFRTREFWARTHRGAGLCLALFLTVAALTGSVLMFRYEINRWLNPEYSVTPRPGPMLDPLALRERALALAPGSRIPFAPLHLAPGEAYVASLQPGVDPATGERRSLGVSAILLDPYTGEEICRVKDTSLWPVTRHNVLAVVGALHNRLALGGLGRWLSGAAALVFLFDCFIGLCLALTKDGGPRSRLRGGRPGRRRSASPEDGAGLRRRRLHRGAGLLAWPALAALALSAVALCLPVDVYLPVMRTLFPKDASFRAIPKLAAPRPEPTLDWREARAIGRRLMARHAEARGFAVVHEQRLAYYPDIGQFVYSVRSDREIIGRGSFTAVYFDGVTGVQTMTAAPRGDGVASAATLWLMALHTGGAGGGPARIPALGLAVLTVFVSASGVFLWLKRRRRRS